MFFINSFVCIILILRLFTSPEQSIVFDFGLQVFRQAGRVDRKLLCLHGKQISIQCLPKDNDTQAAKRFGNETWRQQSYEL